MVGILLVLTALQQDTSYARVASLLAAHDLAAARRGAERLVARTPDDPRAHLLLGRVWLAWPVVGRYDALGEFRRAARLAPGDPEPLYEQVRVGLYLKSDEGEAIAREAILGILSLTPQYRDCWSLFERMYHDEGIWRRADEALSRHADDPVALQRRAEIALALDRVQQADSLAALVPAPGAAFVPALLVRAAAAFDAGQDSSGYAWYDSAVAHADVDSTGALWAQIWMIASPAEVAREATTPPGERRAFFTWFWRRRDPNLVTAQNERIAEHFRRLDYVRRRFHLLHPLATYHFSPARRAVIASFERDSLRRRAVDIDGLFPTLSTDALLARHGAGPDVRASNGAVGLRSLASFANLDARGLLWLRHGAPDIRMTGVADPCQPGEARAGLDLEGWLYHTPDGTLCIALHRPTGVGDFILAPVSRRQAHSARVLMTSDGTSLPATLAATAWSAVFQEAPGRTFLFVRTQPESAAVVLWESDGGEEVARARGTGLLRVSAPPGSYAIGLDVDSAGSVSRVRRQIRLPDFSGPLRLSSVVVATADSLVDRGTALRRMPADRRFPVGRPLATYAEVYGLGRDAEGRARYRVHYAFTRLRSGLPRLLRGPSRVDFVFDREGAWLERTPERLVIEPGRLTPGRYRVTLAVTDLSSNVKSEPIAIEIVMR